MEHFPVGRRLAFDPAKGRLWAVCPACARWNLTPIEERWEALEECERLFATSVRRALAPDVALVRHPSGLDLVRIGTVDARELSTWRWAREMRTRRIRHHLVDGLGAVASLVGMALPLAWLPARGLIGLAAKQYERMEAYRPALHVVGNGDRVLLRVGNIAHASVVPGDAGDWALYVPLGDPSVRPRSTAPFRIGAPTDDGRALTLTGAEAQRALTLAMAHANRRHGADDVRIAARMLATTRSREALLTRTLGELANASRYRGSDYGAITEFSAVQRLLVEMGMTEAGEDSALRGELAALEAAWRDAEEVAAISDSLLVPNAVDQKLKEWKRS